jgi:hypothetical protein
LSTIGDFLRDHMPLWLGGSLRDRPVGGLGRAQSADEARMLAREADAVWQQCLDEGIYGEAFPEPVAAIDKGSAGTRRGDARDKPPGSNGPH